MRKIWSSLLISSLVMTSNLTIFANEQSNTETKQSIEVMAEKADIIKKETQNNKNMKVTEVIDKVNQSVVAIIGKNKTYRQEDYYYSKMPSNLQHGSGVAISSDGKIITNNHVVQDMEEIYVVMYDGKVYKAKLLYKDAEIDLALIKIERKNLKPVELEEMENIEVGDQVVAIGTPLYFGYRNSATQGIVSGLNRPVDQIYTYLQTDALINPGNSGGPLVNMNGKLIGINTLGYSFYAGMNFAIPVENISYFLDQYNKFGKIKRCYTGIEFEENWAAMIGIPSNQGLKVIALKEDAVVKEDQVLEEDLLEAIDGQPITSIAQYNEILKKHLPGDEVTLTFSREQKKYDIKIILKERPELKETK